MINGLFLDPRIWKIDFQSSPFWNPKKYGLNIELHNDAFNIPKTGIDPKYKFVIATEVWEIPMQKTLEYLKSKGLSIFLVPREIAPTTSHTAIMFNHDKFKYKDGFYFSPDHVFAPSKQYADLWSGRSNSSVIGYPRFDIYMDRQKWPTTDYILNRHGLEHDKKIIFFPSYPPYHVQTVDNKSIEFDLYEDLQNTLVALEKYSIENENTQVVCKIHPTAQKAYNKKIGNKHNVSGLLEKYYKAPTKHMKVIGDIRNDSSVARELIMVADKVVGYTSMMLLEAILLNKPVIHFKLEQASKLTGTVEYSDELTTANNKDEIYNLLHLDEKKLLDGKSLINKYLHKVDGNFCQRLCNGIKGLL